MVEKLRNKINPRWVIPIAIGAVLAVIGITALAVSLLGTARRVTEAQAVSIALEHAGVAQEDTVSFSVQQDGMDDGRAVYEVQFTTQDGSYHYDVARNNGDIINYNYNSTATAPAGDTAQTSGGTQAQDVQDEIDRVQSDVQQAQEDQSADQSQTQAVENAIDEATAENIALEHAGVTECFMHRVELDYENGREVYEIEFFAGNTEYDYTIARDTGEILSYDHDIEGWGLGNGNGNGKGNGQQNGNRNNVSSGTASGPVTLEEAVQLVLDRVPGASAEDVRIELDRDDGRDVYEGEVNCNRTEHEFTIDASTGAFIEWSVDYDD